MLLHVCMWVCTVLNRVAWASLLRDIWARTDELKEWVTWLSGWWGAGWGGNSILGRGSNQDKGSLEDVCWECSGNFRKARWLELWEDHRDEWCCRGPCRPDRVSSHARFTFKRIPLAIVWRSDNRGIRVETRSSRKLLQKSRQEMQVEGEVAGSSKAEWTGLLMIWWRNERRNSLMMTPGILADWICHWLRWQRAWEKQVWGSKDMLSLLCLAIILVEILYRQVTPQVQGRVGKLALKAIREVEIIKWVSPEREEMRSESWTLRGGLYLLFTGWGVKRPNKRWKGSSQRDRKVKECVLP